MRFIILLMSALLFASAQTPPSPEEAVYEVGNGVSAPRLTKQVQPQHPSKGFKVTGTVLIGLVVSPSGEPTKVHVVLSLEKDIDQAAVEAVQEWQFNPGMKDGKPVAVKVAVEIRFHDM